MNTKLEHDRRWFERVSVAGVAAILESGYLGIVYELDDVSLGGARLRGARRPPDAGFDILLHVAGRFVTRRAHQVWDGDQAGDAQDSDHSLGIEFDGAHAGSLLEWPEFEDQAFLERHIRAAMRSRWQPGRFGNRENGIES